MADLSQFILGKRSAIPASSIDVNSADVHTKTITANTTFTVTGVTVAPAFNSFILELTNGGNFTVTWWTGIDWAGGAAPSLTANGKDVLGFYTTDGGTNWIGLSMAIDAK